MAYYKTLFVLLSKSGEGQEMRRILIAGMLLMVAVVAVWPVGAHDTDARDPSLERLKDKSPEVRAAAAKSLGSQ